MGAGNILGLAGAGLVTAHVLKKSGFLKKTKKLVNTNVKIGDDFGKYLKKKATGKK